MKVTELKPLGDHKYVDCRSCQNYQNMRGRCHATAQCVNADMFIGKPSIQLWEVKR